MTRRDRDEPSYNDNLLTVNQVAEMLNVPASRIYDRWREWGLPMYRVGQQLRCDPAELEAWIKAHRAV